MFKINRLLSVAILLFLVLGVWNCGGGGSTGSTSLPPVDTSAQEILSQYSAGDVEDIDFNGIEIIEMSEKGRMSSFNDKHELTKTLSICDPDGIGYKNFCKNNCTEWVTKRRDEKGDAPVIWRGHGGRWLANAESAGYEIGYAPKIGAIAVFRLSSDPCPEKEACKNKALFKYGHVAYVEGVDSLDGTWYISEYNYKNHLGYGERCFSKTKTSCYEKASSLIGFIYGKKSSSTTGISYSGLTSQATVESSNAKTLAKDGYSVGTSASFSGKPNEDGKVEMPVELLLYNIFKESIQVTNLSKPLEKTETQTGSSNGNCGGTVSYSLAIDDVTGSFSGTLTYSNYCSMGTMVNGTTTVTGSYDSSSQRIASLTLSMTDLSFTFGSASFTISGTLSINTNTGTITMNANVRNNTTLKVYKVENFTSVVTAAGITKSFRFYHPDYGYVDIATPIVFRFSSGEKYPSSGVMTINGANNTRAKLTAESSTQYSVSADFNGDGTYETTIGTYSWGT